MKRIFSVIVLAALVVVFAASSLNTGDKDGFVVGTPEIKSVNALAFGPNGVLFVGDSKSATVFAIDTKDSQKPAKVEDISIKNVDRKIADALGVKVDDLSIEDMAINPVSGKLYCAVQSGDGTPVIIRLAGEKVESVSLKDVSYSSVELANSIAEDAKDQRGRPLRVWTISDMGFYDGKLMVSGLSNQEFSSTFRSIDFPFNKKQEASTLEVYHAAHGRYETYAPIKTFTIAELKGKKYLVASYTCTPLVLFPLDELKPGKHVKGRTVAEMGSGNTPLDMITLKNNDGLVLLMANSSRPVFIVRQKSIETFEGNLTSPVEEGYGTAGVHFVQMPVVSVLQMDKLDDERFVVMQRRTNGDLDLWTGGRRYLN